MGQTQPTEGMRQTTCFVYLLLNFLPSSLLLLRRGYYLLVQDVISPFIPNFFPVDTVEKNILDLAARQGLSLYTKDNSAGTLNLTPFAMDAGKKTVESSGKKNQAQKGDFIFK